MSHTTRQTLFLRYVLIFLSPPSILLITFLSLALPSPTHPILQTRLCLLLCAPLAASSLVSSYIVWHAHRSRLHPARACRASSMDNICTSIDAALVLALDVIMGSVLLLTAVAGWFIMRAGSLNGPAVGVSSDRMEVEMQEWARWGVVPLVLGFCIHYFLAFTTLENGVLVADKAVSDMPPAYSVRDAKMVGGAMAQIRNGEDEKTPFLTFDWEAVPEKDARMFLGWSSNSVV